MLSRIVKPTINMSSFMRSSQNLRCFAKKNQGNDHLDPSLIEKYNKDFEESLTERQKTFMRADRLALLEIKQEMYDDENNWWNKFKTMSEDDIELMPYGFIKKYGTYLTKIAEYH